MGLLDRRLAKEAQIPWKAVEGHTVLIDYRERELIQLNHVGTAIWNAIDGSRTVKDIIVHIRETFDVGERQAERDVRKFVKHLLRSELVQEAKEP